MSNVAICCDDVNEVSILNEYLLKFSSSHNFKYKLTKFKSLDILINKAPKNIDILLINIKLTSKQSIFNTYQKIRSIYNGIQIIFIPEIVDFMLNGFFLKDFKYMLKPLKYSSFEDEILLCIKDLNNTNKSTKKTNTLIKKTTTPETPINILEGISTRSILFIQSKGDICIIYTRNTFATITYDINILEKSLNPSTFFRCHSNYLINIKKISKLNRTSVVINSATVPVSENKFQDLKSKLLFFLKIV